MKVTELFENRFDTSLDGWYLVDKATDAVVAGPFDSSDDAQKKAMRPPMFANHHRYKVKAFGSALKENVSNNDFIAYVDEHGADWMGLVCFNKESDAKKFAAQYEKDFDDHYTETYETYDGKFVVAMLDHKMDSLEDAGVVFICSKSTYSEAEKCATKLINDGDVMGVDSVEHLTIVDVAPDDYPIKEDLGKPVEIQIEKGLSREEAMKQAPYKKSYGDCRGFSYDKKTGIATWV